MSRYLPLICLALTHTLVDACALLVGPLWPELESSFGLGMAGLSFVFVMQALPTSVSQVVFGYFRDRQATGHLLWMGPVAAALFLTMLGVAPNFVLLCVLLVLGGIGVGAFHPEAAVAAGQLMPEQRTRALSIFMFGGSLGLGLGPLLSGSVGLAGLLFLGPPILLLVWLLRRVGGLGGVSSQSPTTAKPLYTLGEMLAGRGRLAVFLLMICSLRLVPNMAMDKVLSFTLKAHGESTFVIGLTQAVFLTSASAGMFLMALGFRAGLEKTFLIACPLLGIPLMWALGSERCPFWLLIGLLIPTGMVLWGTSPATVSYAQQLFPQGAGLASAMTMGLSWGLASLIQAPLTAYFQGVGTPQTAFLSFIPPLGLAGLGAWFLPAVESETARRPAMPLGNDLPGRQPEAVDA